MPFSQIGSPPTQLGPFKGPDDTLALMVQLALGDRGERSSMVREMTHHVVRGVQSKDYLSEMLAVRHFAATFFRYVNDAVGVEQVQDPQYSIEQIQKHGMAVGDCDDVATLIGSMTRQLGRETEFVVVGFGAPGNYSHVFVRAKEPKSGKWIVLDPVAGTQEADMLRKVTTWKSIRVDA